MNRRNFFAFGTVGAVSTALAPNAWALKYYPMTSTKKIAVLYGTWCGSTRDASLWISEGMGGIADVFDARENPDLAGYDHIIIGGGIRSNVTPAELQDYIKKNVGWLKPKVRGIFAVCGNMQRPVGPEQTTNLIDNHLAKLCEVTGVKSKVFLGRVTKSLMDANSAKMMAQMADYDNLKRPECMAFGKEILDGLK